MIHIVFLVFHVQTHNSNRIGYEQLSKFNSDETKDVPVFQIWLIDKLIYSSSFTVRWKQTKCMYLDTDAEWSTLKTDDFTFNIATPTHQTYIINRYNTSPRNAQSAATTVAPSFVCMSGVGGWEGGGQHT